MTPNERGSRWLGDPVGIICNDDHTVFADVATRIRHRGVPVQFFEPGRRLSGSELETLSLLMNKKVDPESFRALSKAERSGVPTWNGPRTILLGLRLVGYRALERAGFRVPTVHLEKPDTDYVAKSRADWHFHPDPELNGDGDLFQEYVAADPVDHKYYGVDTGTRIEVRVLRTTSKLHGDKEVLGPATTDPAVATKLRRLMRLTGTQALGVDCIRASDECWAVDVNPAMSFRSADLESELADSVFARLQSRPGAPPDRRGVTAEQQLDR